VLSLPEHDEIITIIDEDDKEHEVVIHDILELNGNKYVIVLPVDYLDDEYDEDEYEEDDYDEDYGELEEESDGEAFVLKVIEDEDGEEILVEVTDEEWESIKDICLESLEIGAE